MDTRCVRSRAERNCRTDSDCDWLWRRRARLVICANRSTDPTTPAYLRGSSFGFRFDRRGLRRMGGPSLLFAMSEYPFQRGFVSSGDLLASKAKNLCVSELCPRTGGG